MRRNRYVAACCACGAVNPKGGLKLGPLGGGSEYLWFCRRSMECIKRIAANDPVATDRANAEFDDATYRPIGEPDASE